MSRIRVEVDRELCQGYANCLDAAPSAFDLGDDDIAVPLATDFPAERRSELELAARRCPVGAVVLTELGEP